MKSYQDIVKTVMEEGKWKISRNQTPTLSYSGILFRHNMEDGFPLLTTKKMGLKNIAAELEFFIKGESSKKKLQERGCHIWDEWCNPEKVPYGKDEDTLKRMKGEDDLGRIYGVQWRDWNHTIDQLKELVSTIKTNPESRRMMISSWNPSDLNVMALPPCHYMIQVLVNNKHLDLIFSMRSIDVGLGLPYNIASYGLLLLLLCKECNLEPGVLIGMLGDTHIYEDHLLLLQEQLHRDPYPLPKVRILEGEDNKPFSIFNWKHTDFKLSEYESYGKIPMNISI